jgi:hypothetical protein
MLTKSLSASTTNRGQGALNRVGAAVEWSGVEWGRLRRPLLGLVDATCIAPLLGLVDATCIAPLWNHELHNSYKRKIRGYY